MAEVAILFACLMALIYRVVFDGVFVCKSRNVLARVRLASRLLCAWRLRPLAVIVAPLVSLCDAF